METITLVFLLFIFVLSIFLGLEMVAKVPSLQRLSFLSNSNIVSGAIVIGAILAAGSDDAVAATMSGLALAFALIKIVGSYFLTDRMLKK